MTDLTTQQMTAEGIVFDRLGSIVRSLHDALREIGADKVLTDAVAEFPSARERLVHIGKLTEKAANTVLSRVEEVSPIQDRLAHKARELQAGWDAESVPEALRPLVEQTTQFMADASAGCTGTRGALSDMMMAQDFQDLTGQLIKKVVSLLESTENDLLKLLIEAAPPGSVPAEKKDEMMAGPGAPGFIALEQGDVDDLLADLGF
ncbi:MAG: protein phosphatase CheZ [Burkholderiaceae bacterium]|nr:protein phosphatase CheZ [Burkholderiaceae bacterium]